MSKTRAIVAGIAAAYLLLILVDPDHFVLVSLLFTRIGVPLLVALATALAATGAGFLARWKRPELATNMLIGYPIFGAACFLVGTLHVSAWTMVPLLLLFGGAGVWALETWWLTARQPVQPLPVRSLDAVGAIALSLVLVFGFLAAQAPPSTLDELAYHLAVPHSWSVEGRAIELPLISHSYFPLGIESADLPGFSLLSMADGGIASHFLHLIAALATLVVIWRLSKGSWLATAAIATAPVLAITAGWSLVDWPLLGVCLALIMALSEDDGAAIAAAVAAGMLTKYTFLPFLLLAFIGAKNWKLRPLAIGVAGGSLFFIRNLILTGNPVAPFFSALAPHVSGYRDGAFLSSYVFDGSFIDESLGSSLLALCVTTIGLTGWCMLAGALFLFFLAPSARLLVPFFAAAGISGSRSLEGHRWVRGLIAAGIVVQLLLIGFFVERSAVFSVVSGRASENEFLAQQRASYASVAWLNGILPTASRTLVVGLGETFWFARSVRGGGNFDGPRMSEYLEATAPEAVYERLRSDGITHVAVISVSMATRSKQKVEERQQELTPSAKRMLAMTLDRYATNVVAQGDATLFTLKK